METMKAIAARKSTRAYKAEALSESQIETLLKAAQAAPIGMGAYDTIHITVITNKELLDEIDANAAEFMGDKSKHPLYGAPVQIVISAQLIPGKEGIGFGNAACMVENMALAATDMGLGSVYIFGAIAALNTKPELVKKLGLPEGFTPVSSIVAGYPVEPLEAKEIDMTKMKTDYIK